MTDPPANYHAIPPSENPHRSIGETEDLQSTREWAVFEPMARWTYFFLGCATMLPWNVLANATPFFLSRMTHSDFYTIFASCFSTVFTFTKLICLSYCTITSKQSSPSRRIFASTIVTILFITSLYLSTFVRATPRAFFSFALFNAVSLAISSSYMGAAVYSRAALLGSPFLQNVLSGQAAVAVAISAVQVAGAAFSVWSISPTPTVLAEDDNEYLAEGTTARIFFGVSAVSLIKTLVAYDWLVRKACYTSATATAKQHSVVEDVEGSSGVVPGNRGGTITEASPVYAILKRNWLLMFSLTYAYMITLALYPAITVRVRSMDPAIPPVLFNAIHFLVFNVGDLVGRHICVYPRFVVWSAHKILGLSLIRTLFIPLILLCNIHPATPPVINSDTLYMFVLFALGSSNGHVSCTAMLALSSPVRNPGMAEHREDVDIAAALGATFMILGLAVGALSSFGVEAMF